MASRSLGADTLPGQVGKITQRLEAGPLSAMAACVDWTEGPAFVIVVS